MAADIKPLEMVYDPEGPEAKERAQHPVFTPPSTPTPVPPSAEQLAVDAKAAQDNAAKLAAQPHRTEAEWREQFAKVRIGMTRDEVYALLPNKTASIDYLQRDEYDEEDVHTSFYALDGEFAVALTFDFKGDLAWNAAGRPSPRPKADENHLIKPPVLMRHDKMPDKDNEVYLGGAKLVEAPAQSAIRSSYFADDMLPAKKPVTRAEVIDAANKQTDRAKLLAGLEAAGYHAKDFRVIDAKASPGPKSFHALWRCDLAGRNALAPELWLWTRWHWCLDNAGLRPDVHHLIVTPRASTDARAPHDYSSYRRLTAHHPFAGQPPLGTCPHPCVVACRRQGGPGT